MDLAWLTEKRWLDTSPNTAGDPSGGTGWMEDQTDTNCSYLRWQSIENQRIQITLPKQNSMNIFNDFKSFWFIKPTWVKIAITLIALLAMPMLWRMSSGVLIKILGALFASFILFVAFDLTRELWSSAWYRFATPFFHSDAPDLALLMALLPITYLIVSLLSRIIRKQPL